MNDSPTPPSDEDLSAAIDGEADPAVLDAIASSPSTSARRGELAAVAERIRSAAVPPLPPATVDELIGRALDAPVAPARTTSRTGTPIWARPAVAAAVVLVLVVAGLALVFTGRDDGDDDLALVGAELAEAPADVAAEEAAGTASAAADDTERQDDDAGTDALSSAPEGFDGGEAFGSLEPAELRAVGTFADGDALRAALADGFPAGAAAIEGTEAPATESVERCERQIQVVLDLDAAPDRRGWALVDGATAVVFEFEDTDLTGDAAPGTDTTLVAALDVVSCQPVTLFVR